MSDHDFYAGGTAMGIYFALTLTDSNQKIWYNFLLESLL